MFGRMDRVHADPVAQQRAAGLAARRVDRDDRDLQAIVLVEAEAPHQLVGQRALAGTAGAGDAQHRGFRSRRRRVDGRAQRGRRVTALQHGDRPREGAGADVTVGRGEIGDRFRRRLGEVDVGRGDDLVDHPLQPQLLAVLRGEDPGHAVVVQLADLRRHDDAAAAAEDLDVAGAVVAQQVEHVLEELDVPALVRRDRDALCILLDRAVDDLLDRAVVAEMDHLAAGRLQDAAHDVDRCVVAVEQARGRHEAHLGARLVDQRLAR